MTDAKDNTTVTCLSHKMKYKEVACGKQRMHWLELQFVDENNHPVSGLKVQLEYHQLATEAEVALLRRGGDNRFDPTPPPNPPASVTDDQGLVRFDDLYWISVDVKTDGQPLADEMELRPLGISRNPNSQPVSNNLFRPETRDPKWRSNVQISAEQHGYDHHYVTIGELCDRMPDIPEWTDKEPPRFHFPHGTSLKGTEIVREALEKRHVIEICPFRAWSLVLHNTKDYSLANGYNLGVMADMAYADKVLVEDFFKRKCLDLSTTPRHEEKPFYPHALVVDVPFRERYTTAEFLDSRSQSDKAPARLLLDSTQLFYVENADYVIVAWRGTQEVPDWISDGWYSPQPCPAELAKAGHIHGGFLEAYQLAKERFGDDFDGIRDLLNRGKKLFIAGHSLGGALGLTYAAEMKGFAPILYTYGMPRTFTADAVGNLYQITHYRHVNDSDTIPSVPFDANLDNWLYGKFGPLGTTLGFFWTLTAELPAQMAGAYIGEHYWHHGRPVVFFRATQTRTWLECKTMNSHTCRRLSSSDMHKVKLFLVPSLSEPENAEAKEAQEAFVREFPTADFQKVFPRNTNPNFDHMTSPGQHSMASEYLPFLNNQLLESAWPELKLSRKEYREDFRQQMADYGASSPPEELKRNQMFLALQDIIGSSLTVTRKLPGGENALIRFKSVAEEEVESTR
ncbi:lipase family protein [Enterobacter quasiroggenkampii]|uniref:lipase family protein n=1 Tax=Enterobacter quasiroggenkampii TaxID=2497436 RepID=UPI0021CE107A|nr:lipase family protein [Enterobacter quasiroggenkampii]